ncbi:thioesterase domain-containing protein [Kitasatospora sp. NPDC001095]
MSLYRRAGELGRLTEGIELVTAAARLRPVFDAGSAADHLPEPVQFPQGQDGPALVCLGPYMAPSGVHQYARFAAAFGGRRGIWALPEPGFAPGEDLPGDVEALIEAHATAIERSVGHQPVVLVGYSSGGPVPVVKPLVSPPTVRVSPVTRCTGWAPASAPGRRRRRRRACRGPARPRRSVPWCPRARIGADVVTGQRVGRPQRPGTFGLEDRYLPAPADTGPRRWDEGSAVPVDIGTAFATVRGSSA